jgi:hypothetical protein
LISSEFSFSKSGCQKRSIPRHLLAEERYSANISRNVLTTALCVALAIAPRRLASRDLSTVLIWSSTTWACKFVEPDIPIRPEHIRRTACDPAVMVQDYAEVVKCGRILIVQPGKSRF